MNEEMISGALNPYTKDMFLHRKVLKEAQNLYAKISNSKDDYLKIADRIDYSVEQILMVKHYIFKNIHQLTYSSDVEYHEFDPDLSMAHSWNRLSGHDEPSGNLGTADEKGIEPHDYLLLQHELLEMKLLIDGSCSSQADAHRIAEEKYNYYDASKEFYDSLAAPSKKSTQSKSNTELKDLNSFWN